MSSLLHECCSVGEGTNLLIDPPLGIPALYLAMNRIDVAAVAGAHGNLKHQLVIAAEFHPPW